MVNQHFQSIRQSPEKLLEFFKKMPKGADIHHHALGALRPVDILKKAIELGLWIDTSTAWLYTEEQAYTIPVSQFQLSENAEKFCLENWTIAGFDAKDDPATYFFEVFFKICAVFNGHEIYWLNKILEEAAANELLYIETLIECPSVSRKIYDISENYKGLIDENSTEAEFNSFLEYLNLNGLNQLKKEAAEYCDSWVNALSNHETLLKLQLYTVRNLTPKSVLGQLVLSYAVASDCESVVGVNLVAPEFDPNALRYYSMHMRVCRWLSKFYPNVNLALHAGELTNKLVEEEHLKFHIFEAISIAGAKRIGHGVDLMSESNRNYIFDMMSEKPIAIEILPESNRFILDVSADEHPFESFHLLKVPIVVASDDPGVLNSDLTTQYQKLAIDFPYLTYGDFKEFAFNSIRYCFLPKDIKEQLLLKLEKQFYTFELEF